METQRGILNKENLPPRKVLYSSMRPMNQGSSGPQKSVPEHHGTERELVDSIVAGSDLAWQDFVNRYSGLIQAVIRRNLFSQDLDDVRNVYVDVLTNLYQGGLSKWKGRASLASWLVAITRNQTMDLLRSRYGRHQIPRGIDAMGPRHQKIFNLFHEQGLSFGEVRRTLGEQGMDISIDELIEALAEIEMNLDKRILRRCSYDLQAHAVGVKSGRLLKFLDEVVASNMENSAGRRPDTVLIQKEARELIERIRSNILELPTQDQQVIDLWFDHGQSANEIAAAMDLSNQRKAYTLVSKAIRTLRRRLKKAEKVF